jgi:photosystem II stability/assembly factor-like uncharacterized protein
VDGPSIMHRSCLYVGACLQAILTLAPTTSAAPAPRLLLLDATYAGRNTIVAVGERGAILRSTDSGANWSVIPTLSDARATLTGVAVAPDSPHGWAVGHDALILSTHDAGQTWIKQHQGDDLESSFLDVCALDAQRALAIGAYGLCLGTSDGGRTWAPRRIIDDDAHLNRLTRAPDGTLYIAGERGTLLRSRDSGETWEPLKSPYDGSFYGILPLADGALLAYGLRGHVFRSTDAGETWQQIPLEHPTLVATATQTPDGAVVLAGQSPGLYISRDRGHTVQPWPDELIPAIAELLPLSSHTVLAFGEAGVTRLDIEGVAPDVPPGTSTPAESPR